MNDTKEATEELAVPSPDDEGHIFCPVCAPEDFFAGRPVITVCGVDMRHRLEHYFNLPDEELDGLDDKPLCALCRAVNEMSPSKCPRCGNLLDPA